MAPPVTKDDDEKTGMFSVSEVVARAKAKSGAQAAYLIQIAAKHPTAVGKTVKLDAAVMMLGRATESGFQVEDDGISRRHCCIERGADGKFVLVDLGSTNGTFLNGTRVQEAELADGDKIQVGTNTVLKFSIQDALEEAYQRSIYESATRDGLTNIHNKKYFLDVLDKEFAYSLRHGMALSLVMFDVDHFKRINDTWGHPAGDDVLRRLSARVMETVRTEDVFARYGGEEFAVLLRGSEIERAVVAAERCRKAVESTDFTFEGARIPVTISLGVASVHDDGPFQKPAELLAAADRQLYRSKQGGRNRTSSADR
ncbi:MAG: hypothetical protein RL653_1068 [Pseudomonadota bacterium]|jgi:diguanylate cyclase (GGDEF)-like protein